MPALPSAVRINQHPRLVGRLCSPVLAQWLLREHPQQLPVWLNPFFLSRMNFIMILTAITAMQMPTSEYCMIEFRFISYMLFILMRGISVGHYFLPVPPVSICREELSLNTESVMELIISFICDMNVAASYS